MEVYAIRKKCLATESEKLYFPKMDIVKNLTNL